MISPFLQAYDYVKTKRSIINPHPNFIQLLTEHEATLRRPYKSAFDRISLRIFANLRQALADNKAEASGEIIPGLFFCSQIVDIPEDRVEKVLCLEKPVNISEETARRLEHVVSIITKRIGWDRDTFDYFSSILDMPQQGIGIYAPEGKRAYGIYLTIFFLMNKFSKPFDEIYTFVRQKIDFEAIGLEEKDIFDIHDAMSKKS